MKPPACLAAPQAEPWQVPGPAKEAWKAAGNRYTAEEVRELEKSLRLTIPRRTRRVPHHG